MESVVLIAGALSIWYMVNRSVSQAFLQVYLPVLLLLPGYYHMPIDGLPDPSFAQCAILPIGLMMCWKAIGQGGWKFSPLDFAVLAFLVWVLLANLHNNGYEEAQNSVLDLFTLGLFPYMGGKALIEQSGLRVSFVRRFVWLLFLVVVISLAEFFGKHNFFLHLPAHFFPGQNPGWITQIRWGMGRIAGPYGHSILAGIILAAAIVLERWLVFGGYWEPFSRKIPRLPISKSAMITAGLAAGCIMTLARGPWIGAIVGLTIGSIGTARDKRRGLIRAAAVLALAGLLVFYGSKLYLASFATGDTDETFTSALYRSELLDQYANVAMEHSFWGWGHHFPVLGGMDSIDNGYLLLALEYGVFGLALFVLMVVLAIARTFFDGYRPWSLERNERAFRFTILAVLLSVTVSITTVELGEQVFPLLFLFLGWSDGVIFFAREETRRPAWDPVPSPGRFRFERVIA
ncbi:MAG: O-antigen ligase family protein [Acidobacteriia bacterium]|nr:O-antigen ligase family protein [Terriglobia bacterium]